MSINYTPITDFLTKDTLPKEDPDKVILGADFSSEFDAISTAFLGAASTLNPIFSGTVTFVDATGATLTTTGYATIGGAATVGGNLDVTGNVTATDLTLTGDLNIPGVAIATETFVQTQVDAAVLAPITGLDALADVNVGSVTDGQTIIWDDTAGEWVPLAGNLFLDIDATSVVADSVEADSVEADSIKADSFVETAAVTTGVMDCAVANVFSATLTAPVTLSFTNVPAVDGAYACTLELTSAGNVVTWPTGTVWPTATPPALSAGKDVFVFFTRDGGTTWNGFVAGQEIG